MSTALLTRENTCERYGGITLVTLHRWRKDPDLRFPPPIRIRRRVFWRQADLDLWDETRIAPAA